MMTLEMAPVEALKEFFGFSKFKGEQEAVIKSVLEGRDTFVIMPTGGGKSLCYQLPALMQDGTAVVVSPLIALMKNQVDALRGYSTDKGIAHFLNSSLSRAELQQVRSLIPKTPRDKDAGSLIAFRKRRKPQTLMERMIIYRFPLSI